MICNSSASNMFFFAKDGQKEDRYNVQSHSAHFQGKMSDFMGVNDFSQMFAKFRIKYSRPAINNLSMKVSTGAQQDSSCVTLQGSKLSSLLTWSKNKQQRFQFKLYTYTPKGNQSNRNKQVVLDSPSSHQYLQRSACSKLQKATTQDCHESLKKQIDTSKEHDQIDSNQKLWDGEVKMTSIKEKEQGDVVTATPSKRVRKIKTIPKASDDYSSESWDQRDQRKGKKYISKKKKKGGKRGGRAKDIVEPKLF